jgi:hypothetical protein
LGNLLDDFRLRCQGPQEKMALVADLHEPTGEPETGLPCGHGGIPLS